MIDENKELKTKIGDLEQSLQFTQDELIDRKIDDLYYELNGGLNVLSDECKDLREKNRKLEDRCRRNNLRIDGVAENEHETWEQTEEKVKKLIKDKLEIEKEIEIERAHRMVGNQSSKTRTIIFKLLSYKDKETILKNSKKLKGSGIYINEDFSEDTMKIRSQLRTEMKKIREEGKFCVINYDRLLIRTFKGKKIGNPEAEDKNNSED